MLTFVYPDGRMVSVSRYHPDIEHMLSGGRMAEAAKKLSVELDVIEKSWVHVSLMAKREQLVRSRNKEVTGSEIWVLRGKEIEALNALTPKFS